MKLGEANDKPKMREVECFSTYELEIFDFLLGLTIWYEILFVVNSASNDFQYKDMRIDVAIE